MKEKPKLFIPHQLRVKACSCFHTHKPVSSSTLAGQISRITDTRSMRSSASSAACNARVALFDFLEAAGWSNESTFTRFYMRAIFNDKFAKGVLSENGHCSDSSESE